MHNYMLADIARVLKKRSVRVEFRVLNFDLALLLLFYGGNGAVRPICVERPSSRVDFFPLVTRDAALCLCLCGRL